MFLFSFSKVCLCWTGCFNFRKSDMYCIFVYMCMLVLCVTLYCVTGMCLCLYVCVCFRVCVKDTDREKKRGKDFIVCAVLITCKNLLLSLLNLLFLNFWVISLISNGVIFQILISFPFWVRFLLLIFKMVGFEYRLFCFFL